VENIAVFVGAALRRIGVIVGDAGYSLFGVFGAADEVSDEQIVHQIDTNLPDPLHAGRACGVAASSSISVRTGKYGQSRQTL